MNFRLFIDKIDATPLVPPYVNDRRYVPGPMHGTVEFQLPDWMTTVLLFCFRRSAAIRRRTLGRASSVRRAA